MEIWPCLAIKLSFITITWNLWPSESPTAIAKPNNYSSLLRWQLSAYIGNYRPISVSPTVAKIFEITIYNQLYQYLNENGLLNSSQSGFRSLHSTLTACLETNDNSCDDIDRGLLNGVIFIDLREAFNTIYQEIILKKTYVSMALSKTPWSSLNLT